MNWKDMDGAVAEIHASVETTRESILVGAIDALQAKLKQYEEREPLVQAFLAIWAKGWTNNDGKGGVTLDDVNEAVVAVRDFKLE